MDSISASVTSSDGAALFGQTRRHARGGRLTGSRVRFFHIGSCLGLALILLLASAAPSAEGVDEDPESFINEVFTGHPPPSRVLWITRALREPITHILGHAPEALRVRYWGEQHRTAWILDEIGKERPITVGLVVDNGHLETVKVLAFRESRGWEVRYPFFTDQFKGAGLTGDDELDRSIDGISGATLSVRALKKLARLALFLHSQTPMAHDTP